jgi:hypothetical protein
MRNVRWKMDITVAGGYMKGSSGKQVITVTLGPDGRNVRPGLGIVVIIVLMNIHWIASILFKRYFRSQTLWIPEKKARAQLLSNAFGYTGHPIDSCLQYLL